MSENTFEQMSLDGLDELDLRETDNGEAKSADAKPEDVRNGVYMLVVRTEGDDVNATPVLFTMGESGAEPVEDAPSSANEFYDMVAEDMGDLFFQLVRRTKESGMERADAMIQLLTDMQHQPQELVHNMLSALIVDAAAELAKDHSSAEANMHLPVTCQGSN